MKLLKSIIAASVLAISLSLAPHANAASTPLTDGIWESFFWSNLGPIDSNAEGYQITVPVGFIGLLRVVDGFLIGDQFDVFQNPGGFFSFSTSAFSGTDGAPSGASDGDSAWSNLNLSKGSKEFGVGIWEIDISTNRLALGSNSGEAFIRLDLAAVPEPATNLLLGIGLVLMALGGRMALARRS
jgi:PEP-CTERM motif